MADPRDPRQDPNVPRDPNAPRDHRDEMNPNPTVPQRGPSNTPEPRNVPTPEPHLERRGAPVDDPPGIYDHQGRPENEPPPPVPDWPIGANPPGTNPLVEPAEDPARVPVPGSVPGIERGLDQQLGEGGPTPAGAPGAPRPPQAGGNPPAHAQGNPPPHGAPKADDKDKDKDKK